MASGNGDSRDEEAEVDTVKFLRLVPPDGGAGPEYQSGIGLFLRSLGHDADDIYVLTMSEKDARRLSNDLNDYFAGRLDISNLDDNYGRGVADQDS
jgi:hypothetical protein